ncbi:phosphatase PAP2 family protein [Luteimicrobium subarcticum]|uniref:PAP2 superfamily protein n=1 Tax=Luteimicrobium subarcticum TaxID=620910 RepID=A0A2M8WSH8_9MICO|nr:phosphatase PAP2 family protein [Luteimicrobium subarcticum]PJI93902.1 PAP2 superfamily protein [Luteimicrobium subarcticum]
MNASPPVTAPPRPPVRDRLVPDGVRRAVAVVCAVLLAVSVFVLWWAFVDTIRGQGVDELARRGATYGQGQLWQVASPVLDVVSVSFVAVGIATAMAVALLRRRWGLAVQVAVLVAGANLTTEVLKHVVLDRPHLLAGWTGENGLPSGHTTVAASVSAALVLASSRRVRPFVALAGACYTALTGVSTLVGQWHRPSDVVAALCVVGAWSCAVCAVTPRSSLDVVELDGTGRVPRAVGSYVTAVVLLGAAGLAGAVALGALHDVLEAVEDMLGALWAIRRSVQVTAYIGGAFGVVATTCLVFTVILAVRQLTAVSRRTSRRTTG